MTNLIILGIAAVFALWAAFIAWNYFGIKREAGAVYRAALNRGEFPASEPFAPFEAAYIKTSVLRVSIYRWLACLVAVISVPVVVWFFNWLWVRCYYLFGLDDVFSEGQLIHSFYLAICSLGGLVLVAGVFAWFYHRYRPIDFDVVWAEEKLKTRGESPLAAEAEQEA